MKSAGSKPGEYKIKREMYAYSLGCPRQREMPPCPVVEINIQDRMLSNDELL